MAASNTSLVAIKALIDAGANLEAKDYEWGMAPLHVAVASNPSRSVIRLLETLEN